MHVAALKLEAAGASSNWIEIPQMIADSGDQSALISPEIEYAAADLDVIRANSDTSWCCDPVLWADMSIVKGIPWKFWDGIECMSDSIIAAVLVGDESGKVIIPDHRRTICILQEPSVRSTYVENMYVPMRLGNLAV